MDDLSKALLSIITGALGALIALYIKDFFDHRTQTRTADIDEYGKVRAMLDDPLLATLQECDFLAGMRSSRFKDQLGNLGYAYQGGRQLIFHDKVLNAQMLYMLARSEEFLQEVAGLTVPDGDPPVVSTRSRGQRLYPTPESAKKTEDEAKKLDAMGRELSHLFKTFVDTSKRRLRT